MAVSVFVKTWITLLIGAILNSASTLSRLRKVIPDSIGVDETPWTPSQLPRGLYSSSQFLGRGSNGKVYKGVRAKDGSLVAIKRIKKRPIKGLFTGLNEEQRRHIALYKSLDNEHLVKLKSVLESTDHLFLVMEYCAGGDLIEFSKARDNLTEDMAKPIIKQIASGIQYLHHMGVIHGDIKPDNVLVCSAAPLGVKITDFDLAIRVEDVQVEFEKNRKKGTIPGTRQYLAPELLTGGTSSYAVDVFALGVTMYTLMIGLFPFPSPIDAINGNVEHLDRVSPLAADLIRGMLHGDPQLRLNIDQVLQHPWYKDNELPQSTVGLLGVVNGFSTYLQSLVNGVWQVLIPGTLNDNHMQHV